MKKSIILTLFLTQFIFADGLKIINSISDIPKNKNIVLIFSMQYCPYCVRQENSIIKNVQPKFPDIEYLKVMRDTKVFQELIETGNFGEVEYYPTTFILKINQSNQIDVKYPFKGFQRSSNLISILTDSEIMAD
jgi:hypothetical protein